MNVPVFHHEINMLLQTLFINVQRVIIMHGMHRPQLCYLNHHSPAQISGCCTRVANMSERSTELHWILDYKHIYYYHKCRVYQSRRINLYCILVNLLFFFFSRYEKYVICVINLPFLVFKCTLILRSTVSADRVKYITQMQDLGFIYVTGNVSNQTYN